MLESDLEMVRQWRNHPDIRRHMFTQREIDGDEHRRWFESSMRDPRRHLLVFEQGGNPLGFVNVLVKNDGQDADWGFYTAPTARKGTGRLLGRATLSHVFDIIGVRNLHAQALESNDRSIRFHLSLGFRRVGKGQDECADTGGRANVICFALSRREWEASDTESK